MACGCGFLGCWWRRARRFLGAMSPIGFVSFYFCFLKMKNTVTQTHLIGLKSVVLFPTVLEGTLLVTNVVPDWCIDFERLTRVQLTLRTTKFAFKSFVTFISKFCLLGVL